MIYGSMIYEQQFNNLINSKIDPMMEFYQNEVELLESIIEMNDKVSTINEDNDLVTHDKYINADYEVKDVKDSFVKKAIAKLKEILKKFIEWCKKLGESIKNFFIKDSKTMKDNILKNIKDLEKAETFNEIKKYSSKIGAVKRDSRGNIVSRFDVKDYITDAINELKPYFVFIKINSDVMHNIFKDLKTNKNLSENTTKQAKEFVSDIKKLYIKRSISKLNYFKAYTTVGDTHDLNRFKQLLITYAKEDLNAIDFIDNKSTEINNNIKTLQQNANRSLNELNQINGKGLVSNDIALATSVVNGTLNTGKKLYQEELKILSGVKNLYRITK